MQNCDPVRSCARKKHLCVFSPLSHKCLITAQSFLADELVTQFYDTLVRFDEILVVSQVNRFQNLLFYGEGSNKISG